MALGEAAKKEVGSNQPQEGQRCVLLVDSGIVFLGFARYNPETLGYDVSEAHIVRQWGTTRGVGDNGGRHGAGGCGAGAGMHWALLKPRATYHVFLDCMDDIVGDFLPSEFQVMSIRNMDSPFMADSSGNMQWYNSTVWDGYRYDCGYGLTNKWFVGNETAADLETHIDQWHTTDDVTTDIQHVMARELQQ